MRRAAVMVTFAAGWLCVPLVTCFAIDSAVHQALRALVDSARSPDAKVRESATKEVLETLEAGLLPMSCLADLVEFDPATVNAFHAAIRGASTASSLARTRILQAASGEGRLTALDFLERVSAAVQPTEDEWRPVLVADSGLQRAHALRVVLDRIVHISGLSDASAGALFDANPECRLLAAAVCLRMNRNIGRAADVLLSESRSHNTGGDAFLAAAQALTSGDARAIERVELRACSADAGDRIAVAQLIFVVPTLAHRMAKSIVFNLSHADVQVRLAFAGAGMRVEDDALNGESLLVLRRIVKGHGVDANDASGDALVHLYCAGERARAALPEVAALALGAEEGLARDAVQTLHSIASLDDATTVEGLVSKASFESVRSDLIDVVAKLRRGLRPAREPCVFESFGR